MVATLEAPMPARRYQHALEYQYRTFHRRRYVRPDPLQCLYDYADPADQEVVGLVAATLAYGRVKQILRSVGAVLERIGPQPARFVNDATPDRLARALAGFKHRFTTGDEMAALLAGAGRVRRRSGSLGACLARAVRPGDETVLGALAALAGELRGSRQASSLLSDVAKGSACKRLHLLLRWMVRRDEVDPGPWRSVPPGLLVVPLDTHLHAIARALGLTARRAADARTALEVTRAFRAVAPDDPVRYDFSLTRLGIHPDARPCEFLARM